VPRHKCPEPGHESLGTLLLEAVRASRRSQGLPEEPTEDQLEAMRQLLGLWAGRPMEEGGTEPEG
jgi:hypothetical protein